MFHRYIETVAERAAAFSRYAPASRIGTDIDLYRAREIENTHGFDREDGNWADFTCAAFSLRWSPGDHFSMVKGRHAADLAEHIQSRISKPLPGPK
jgi:thioesterase domain-containing protein